MKKLFSLVLAVAMVLSMDDLLDSAFVSRFSTKQEMKPFTTEENQKMIQMFLSDIGYEFDETEINRIVKGTHDQREIMSKTIQLLAEKI